MFNKKVWNSCYAQFDLKNATMKIKDGSTNEITIKLGDGNLTFTERRNIEYTLDRGLIDEVREGDEVPMDVSIDAVWEYIKGSSSSGGTPTIIESLKKQGSAASWTSSDTDTCRPYAVDIEITYAPTPTSCGDQEVITIADFRYEQIDYDTRAGTFSISGRANVTEPTTVRSAQ